MPRIEQVPSNLTDGHLLTLRCHYTEYSSQSPPLLTWLSRRRRSAMFVPLDDVSTTYSEFDNGTTLVVSEATVRLDAESDGTTYKCLSSSLDDLGREEDGELSSSVLLNVQCK